ncbi:enoyl-CoA hydratase [Rhodobacterales bacterium HTCC2150]|nr:enoyl-CoA hydratase [Rhodobacterales bacterium HTCC2150] [Rhodobacteraceae bacterium HTCC2150]
MSYEAITLERGLHGLVTISLNDPSRHNALNPMMIDELTRVANDLGSDASVRVVVLTGAGRSFCAGGDLGWMKQQMTATSAERAAEARKLAKMLAALANMPKPLIGRIQGQAFGGGIGMISVCDIAIAVDTANFALTETRLGLIPATISPYVVGAMGKRAAQSVFLSGRRFTADEGVALNLITRVVGAGDLDAAIAQEVAHFATCAPNAVGAAKALLHRLDAPVTQDIQDMSIQALVDTWEDPEASEGVGAFFEKRPANWVE